MTSLVLPAGVDLYMSTLEEADGRSQEGGTKSILSTLRLIRLMKLARLVRNMHMHSCVHMYMHAYG